MTLFWGCEFPSINLLVVRLLKKLLCPKTLLKSVAQLEPHTGHEGVPSQHGGQQLQMSATPISSCVRGQL